jgi:hypothetical protein
LQKEKAMLTTEAHVQTEQPGRYLTQPCRHAQQVQRLRHRPPHDPDDSQPPNVERVEWSETRGTIGFDRGWCTMQTDGNLLPLHAEAADEQSQQGFRTSSLATLKGSAAATA